MKSTYNKEELALEVIKRLKEEYPEAGCTLDYDQAWKLLVSVRLAAQCTDARVNVVVEELYEKYPDIEALAAAEPEDIEKIVRPYGLGKSNISCKVLVRWAVQNALSLKFFVGYIPQLTYIIDEHEKRKKLPITDVNAHVMMKIKLLQ